MAEDLNHAKIYFWLYAEYVYNCHESGELQGYNQIKNIKSIIVIYYYILILDKALCD